MDFYYLIVNFILINLAILIANITNNKDKLITFDRVLVIINFCAIIWWIFTKNQPYLYFFGLFMVFLSLEDLHNHTAHSNILIIFLPLIIQNIKIVDLFLSFVLLVLIFNKYLGAGDFLPIMIINSFFNYQQFSILICITAMIAIATILKTRVNKIALLPLLSVALLIFVSLDKLFQPVLTTLAGTFEF